MSLRLKSLKWMLLGLLLLAPSGGTLPPISSAVYVYGRADFQAGNGGSVSAMRDFNGDGRPDFAALGFQNDSVVVLLAQPDGSFTDSGATYTVGVEPVAAAAEDFNSDGRLDVAVVNLVCPPNITVCPPGSVSVLLGNGDGTFQPRTDYVTGPAPIAVATGDFNADGRVDLAVADRVSVVNTGSPGMVSVLLGNGDGTFQPPTDFAAGDGLGGLVAGDFNGDSKLDLVVQTHPSVSSTTVPVFLGNGDGTFQPAMIVDVGADPIALATGDFNKDGRLDLAIATGLPKVAVLLGNGPGTFQAPADYATDLGPVKIITADLNADGNQDLLVSVSTGALFSGGISVLQGKGDGTFQARRDSVAGTVGPLFARDFDADGKLDVAIGSGSGGARIVLGNGDGSLAHPVDHPSGTSPAGVVTGDLNGDGKLDLAVTNFDEDTVAILLGNSNGTFGPRVGFPTGDGPNGVVAADFSGDAKLDLGVVNFFGNTVSILLGNGDGTFRPRADFASGAGPIGVVAADFNGDNKVDLAVTSFVDTVVSVRTGNGDGTFGPRADFATGPGPGGIVASDLNNDGRMDLAVADSGTPMSIQDPGLVSILLGNGDGSFQTRSDTPIGSLTPISLTAKDFNGDGKLDLAVSAQLNELGFIFIKLGSGNGSFQDGDSYFTGAFASEIAASDFNGDAIQDLAVSNSGSRTMAIWKGKGDGTFQPQSNYGTGSGPNGLAPGDFNGDSQPDMAVAVAGSNSVSIFLSGAA